MTVNLNVIEPVSPYTTDVFRADYMSACLRHVAALLEAVPEAAGTLARFAAAAADGPHPYLSRHCPLRAARA